MFVGKKETVRYVFSVSPVNRCCKGINYVLDTLTTSCTSSEVKLQDKFPDETNVTAGHPKATMVLPLRSPDHKCRGRI